MIEDFEDFTDHAESEDSCEDCKEALRMIRHSTKDAEDVAAKLYAESCQQVAAHVEKFWPEIEAVAKRLSEVGYLEGEEVKRIVEGVRRRGPK